MRRRPFPRWIFFALFLCLWGVWSCASRRPASAPPGRPAHHTENGFKNPHMNEVEINYVKKYLSWYLGYGSLEKPAFPRAQVAAYQAEVVPPDPNHLSNPHPGKIQVTWIGHSTFLLQFDGLNILTDPVFARHASPFPTRKTRRRAPLGMSLEELPPIDAVIISHNHYDHLDAATVRELGNRPRYFVPLKQGDWFRKKGITNVVELDWWQSAEFGPVRFHCVPAQHFSSRGLGDRNRALWCGWVMETSRGKIYFVGDSGYFPGFRQIGRRVGPLRLAFIPIGAYYPRWGLEKIHISPTEAVSVHREVGSQQSIGMHWGTFKFGDEPMAEPPLYLQKALKDSLVSPEAFVVFKIGETRSYPWTPSP